MRPAPLVITGEPLRRALRRETDLGAIVLCRDIHEDLIRQRQRAEGGAEFLAGYLLGLACAGVGLLLAALGGLL